MAMLVRLLLIVMSNVVLNQQCKESKLFCFDRMTSCDLSAHILFYLLIFPCTFNNNTMNLSHPELYSYSYTLKLLECYHIYTYVGILQLPKMPKEGYVCKAYSSECLVYLPQEIEEKLFVETITDSNVHPKISSNEIKITPVVRITCGNPTLSLEMPAIVELAKSIELSHEERDNKLILFCASSESEGWKELGSESNCSVFKDRISFEVTQCSLYAVISRKPHPSSKIELKPSTEIPVPHNSQSIPTDLMISALPGFKVHFPPFSINADKETEVTATLLYDSSAVCSEANRSRLASSVIELEPHGATFSKEVSISIPIPNYAEIKQRHPHAQVKILHASKHTSETLNELDWSLVEHIITQDEENRYIATVRTRHFSWYQPIWDLCHWTSSQLCAPLFRIKERCQVFMSQETQVKQSQDITFSISVLFYPFKEEPEPLPPNYNYMLLDSGLLDLIVSNNDALHFEVELNGQLSPKRSRSIAGSLIISGRQQKCFTVELDRQEEIQESFPIGELSIGVRDHDYHTLTLIKVSSTYN